MPKISDIQETPNPNAIKFILREPVSRSVARSFKTISEAVAANDLLARELFGVGEVVSVFYMDYMITVEKEESAEWDELLPKLAIPIRAAEPANVAAPMAATAVSAAAAVGGAIAAAVSDDPRLAQINELLDERIRPALAGDGGWLEDRKSTRLNSSHG